jgi:ribonuclease E
MATSFRNVRVELLRAASLAVGLDPAGNSLDKVIADNAKFHAKTADRVKLNLSSAVVARMVELAGKPIPTVSTETDESSGPIVDAKPAIVDEKPPVSETPAPVVDATAPVVETLTPEPEPEPAAEVLAPEPVAEPAADPAAEDEPAA